MPKVKRLILGVTGGLATGKSTVMKMLEGAGIPGISSDDISHQAMAKGKPPYRAVLKTFGSAVLDRNGEIDRKLLGERVFGNPKKRRALEKIIHPHVVRALRKFLSRHRRGTVALDIPLLFEAKLSNLVDKILVVSATREQQIQRFCHRTGLPPSMARKRIRAQWPLTVKKKRADVILDNSKTLAYLRSQIRTFLQIL